MRRHLTCTSLLILTGITLAQDSNQTTPYWAYALNPNSAAPASKPDDNLRHVPDSDATFTVAQTQDFFNPPDWHPSGHPAMPENVAHGRKPDVYACAYCHFTQRARASRECQPRRITRRIHRPPSGRFQKRYAQEFRAAPQTGGGDDETKATDPEILSAAEYLSKLSRRIRSGARSGQLSQQMQAPVKKLEVDDMIAIAAYVASLSP